MRKLTVILIIILAAAITGGGLYLYLTTNVSPPQEFPVVTRGELPQLPKDEKAAKRELQTARKNLANLKPGKPYIVIDTHANKIYLRTHDSVLLEATCSTGSGGEYLDSATGRRWIFDTPRGVFKIDSRIPHPWWRKPDWAFLEEGEEIPKDERERYDPNMMGDYALGFGDGYFIHGTIYERLLGINVTHGCVRVGSEELEKLYNKSPMGTYVYIF